MRVARLCPEKPTEAERHARALLAYIEEWCPETVGHYVPVSDLAKSYREFAEAEGWTAKGWTAIARHLGRMTDKKSVKRAGRRFTAYRIPKCPCGKGRPSVQEAGTTP